MCSIHLKDVQIAWIIMIVKFCTKIRSPGATCIKKSIASDAETLVL